MRLSNPDVVLLPAILPVLFVGLLPLAILPLVGFFGLAVLGILIGFAAIMEQLQEQGDHTRHVIMHGGLKGAEHAGHKSEMRSRTRALLVAKIVSAGLIVAGLGGFFLFQVGR
jgi:hypothetical protein